MNVMNIKKKSLKERILTSKQFQRAYYWLVSRAVADAYLISFPKSGRTWVRMLLGQALAKEYGLKINLDLYKMTFGRGITNVATDPRIGNYAQFGEAKEFEINRNFRNKKIIFLVRDPRDVAVSYYFEWMKRRNVGETMEMSEFIRKDFTLPRIVEFMNGWAAEMEKRKEDFLLVRYEDLHKDAKIELKRMVDFLGIKISDENIAYAVEQSRFQKMRQMEEKKAFGDDHRMIAVNPDDKESYKMRKGKAGGYKEYLNLEDIDYINSFLSEMMDKKLGYCDYS
jgi:hypothetical protein